MVSYPNYPAAGLTITHALGDLRKAGASYLAAHHYMRSNGGSGALYVVEDAGDIQGACLVGATTSRNVHRALLGACLIGPSGSPDAERALAEKSVTIRQIKRLHMLDGVPMYESQLLRHAMQQVCDELDEPILFVSYADGGAVDVDGVPMGGFVYLTAGFAHIGDTKKQRWFCRDHNGRARSTRQGPITLSKRNLPKQGEIFHGEYITADWTIHKLPPARIWIAIQTPSRMTRLQAKRAWRSVMRRLNPKVRLAMQQWIDFKSWDKRPHSVTSLGAPKRLRGAQRLQPAYWPPELLHRTAAPIWVPLEWQAQLLLELDVMNERTAGRRYVGLDV